MAAPGFHIGVKDIIVSGGPTLAFLAALSVYAVALMAERWRFHRKAIGGMAAFADRIRLILQAGDLNEALAACRHHRGLAASVVMATLIGSTNRDDRRRAADRAITRAAAELNSGLTTIGTVASVAPFIGLFGTVIGVMRAFKDLAAAAGAGPGVVAVGISEALVCTAAGLFVAIPAVAAYNHFSHRTERFSEEMSLLADELLDKLAEKAAR